MKTIRCIFRQPWYKRLWDWFRGCKPGTLWQTTIFDEPITVNNGDTLNMTYKIKK